MSTITCLLKNFVFAGLFNEASRPVGFAGTAAPTLSGANVGFTLVCDVELIIRVSHVDDLADSREIGFPLAQ